LRLKDPAQDRVPGIDFDQLRPCQHRVENSEDSDQGYHFLLSRVVSEFLIMEYPSSESDWEYHPIILLAQNSTRSPGVGMNNNHERSVFVWVPEQWGGYDLPLQHFKSLFCSGEVPPGPDLLVRQLVQDGSYNREVLNELVVVIQTPQK
jgi:hypothetical protein